jgi:ABC-type polysaccharide/polyol phosphate export permease
MLPTRLADAWIARLAPSRHLRLGELETVRSRMIPQYGQAWRDISAGIGDVNLWGRLGWQEVKRRYRRTAFGPLWSTLSLGIFVLSLGFIWANLWHQETRSYLPFLSGGLVAWVFVSTLINESCTVFTAAESLIKQVQFPYTSLVCATVWRNLIVLLHNCLILIIVDLVFGLQQSFNTFLVIPGLILVSLNALWIGIILGSLCTRYRDVAQLVATVLQISIYVTPIFWLPEQLGPDFAPFVDYNPLYHWIDLIRAPLLGSAPQLWSYTFVGICTVVGWAVTFFFFARFRSRLAYWL